MNIFRGSGVCAESSGLSIGGGTSQIRVDLAAFSCFLGAEPFVICSAGGFRGGRLGGFPAFLGLGFGEICGFHELFSRLGGWCRIARAIDRW